MLFAILKLRGINDISPRYMRGHMPWQKKGQKSIKKINQFIEPKFILLMTQVEIA